MDMIKIHVGNYPGLKSGDSKRSVNVLKHPYLSLFFFILELDTELKDSTQCLVLAEDILLSSP